MIQTTPSPRLSLRVLAALLGYPDAALRAALPGMAGALDADAVVPAARRDELRALVRDLQRSDPYEVEEMYHVMAIANYEDRFVIPSTHREYAENAFSVRGGCGFSFGNGCSEGIGETSLFGSEKKRTIPIKAVV